MAKRDLNVDWKKYYEEHKGTIADAAKLIKDGDCLWLSNASCTPYKFLDYLNEHYEEYHDVMLIYNCMNEPTDLVFNPDVKNGHFRMFSAFNLPLERVSMDMDVAECGGMSYDLFPCVIDAYNCNTAAVMLCPPDEEGWCNVGAYQVCTHKPMTQDPRIEKKIGFIDPTGQYPVPGDRETHYIHVSELDCIVDCPTELVAIPAPLSSEVDKVMADYILPYLKEGDKIQIGWGGLGEEVLNNLRGIGNVEVYSEVACETMMDLVKEGIITKIRCSSPGGCSREFFEWASTDPRIQFLPQSECIDALGVCPQENIVSINSTFQVDLIGQACSEAQGLKPYTGPGGSFAYLYGAIRSKGGRSFLCLRSTHNDSDGNPVSNVHAWMPEGCIVTTPKVFVMYVVTEYGVANVFMKTMKDRIRAIIKIAHPDYREELKEKICTTPLISEKDFEGIDLFDNVNKSASVTK